MEGNASVYRVLYPVSRITGEGRAELLRAWGPGFEQEGAGGGRGEEMGGATQNVRGNYKSLKGTNLTVVEGMNRFMMYPVNRTTSDERAECARSKYL